MNNNNDTVGEKEDAEFIPDEEGAFPDAEQKVKKLRAELAACDREKRGYLDGWQRAKADFINYKKDEGKRFEDVMRYAAAGFMEDILPVMDSLDLALAAGAEGDATQGILLIRSQMEQVLKKRGVTEIPVQIGEAFNPESHESIGEIESEHPAASIAEISQKGYALAGRVIRPARVKLSKSQDIDRIK